MADEEVRMTLRLPRELRDWLRAHAQRERRSLNSELVYMLEVARAAVERDEQSP
ncbi:Arc family DNA-binding protein [Streptomyces sp. NPDC096538]|uniref:Arc family DNA-binding protein n=1 Tax=Streptomyces sp. NPDC096538 TaxID=3155427 RepID=UPI00331D7727